MYGKIIAVGKLQESAVMHTGNVKDLIVFRLYPDTTQAPESDTCELLPLECKLEVYKGDDYLLALKPGTTVFVEGDLSISENPDLVFKCIVRKMFMIVVQQMNH